jgi:branched-chain amino acid transport system ATP-binding protein
MPTMASDNNILEVVDLGVNYGIVQALSNINIHVQKGEIVTLLGPNGAGKSTLVLAIAGILPISNGKVVFNGQTVNAMMAEQLVKLGITLIPEGKSLFRRMKTVENLEVGAYSLRRKQKKKEIKENINKVFNIFPNVKKRAGLEAGLLSGGEQQMVAIGRGLMSQPKLLLLDEPSLGLSPLLVKEVMNTLALLRKEQGVSILLAEQNAVAALSIADRGYVMGTGRIITEGASEDLCAMDKIKKMYLSI